jgi:nitrite reductase/ring-hydroxylating ferredoxin subunit
MGSVSAQLIDELGYDPDDGLPDLADLGGVRPGRGLARGAMIAARLASGRLVVVADECPHDGGRISDGFVDGERLVCARHGWELEARHGRCERACKPRE